MDPDPAGFRVIGSGPDPAGSRNCGSGRIRIRPDLKIVDPVHPYSEEA